MLFSISICDSDSASNIKIRINVYFVSPQKSKMAQFGLNMGRSLVKIYNILDEFIYLDPTLMRRLSVFSTCCLD